MKKSPIHIQTIIKAPLKKVWQYWTQPAHIVNWTFASDDWHAPESENDLRIGGKFRTLMAARDKSVSFDFEGHYTNIKEDRLIEYDLTDGRHVKVEFSDEGGDTKVTEIFDPESTHSLEQQRVGWQAILDNFKKYTETSS